MRHTSFCRQFFGGILALTLLFAPLARAEVIELDNAGLGQLIADGAVVVDIRRVDEWQQTGIIGGSHLITFFHDKEYKVFDMAAWLAALRKVATPNQPVVLICRTGSRTKSVTNFLDQRAGYTKVYNVTEGITRWIKDGNPTVPYQGK